MPNGALAWLQLFRVGMLLSPAADVIAGLCLAGMPWSGEAARAVFASVCAYAAGMVLNDHADRASDAMLRPERPIPAGRVRVQHALWVGLSLLALSIAMSPLPQYHASIAALVLGYDYAFKRWPVAGALGMGVLRGLNLAAGAVAVTAAAPPPQVSMAAAVYAAYIVAVTLLGVLEDARSVPTRAVFALQHVPPLAGALVMLGMPQPWPAAAIAAVLAVLFLRRVRRVTNWDRAAIRRSMSMLLLGTMLYTGTLCLAAGRTAECLAIATAAVVAKQIAKRIAVT